MTKSKAELRALLVASDKFLAEHIGGDRKVKVCKPAVARGAYKKKSARALPLQSWVSEY